MKRRTFLRTMMTATGLLIPKYSNAFNPFFAIGGNWIPKDDPYCMGCWAMTANGGNENDLSGEGGTLIETGGTIPTSATRPSGFGGTSRGFEVGDTEWLAHADGGSTDISGANQSLTLCSRIKTASLAADMLIINKYEAASGKRQYALRADFSASGVLVANLSGDGETFTSAIGATNVADGNWHHVALVYNDIDIRLYVDGSLDSNGADNPKIYSSGLFNGASEFSIGANSEVPDRYFDGLIYEAGVFSRNLSAAEIVELNTVGMDGNKGAG